MDRLLKAARDILMSVVTTIEICPIADSGGAPVERRVFDDTLRGKWGNFLEDVKTQIAFGSGVFGAMVMLLIMGAARLAGIDINMPMILGTIWGGAPDALHWFMGLLIHVALYGGIGLLYGAAFEFVTHRANWLVGAIFSVPHMIGAGLFFYALPYFHPLIPEVMHNPGPFMASEGSGGVLIFMVVHLVYGFLLGHFYGRVVHHVPADEILI